MKAWSKLTLMKMKNKLTKEEEELKNLHMRGINLFN
jgi:hypothetical protein